MEEKWLGRATATRVRSYRPGDDGYGVKLAQASASGGGLPPYGVGSMPGASWTPPASAPVYPAFMQPIAASAPAAPAAPSNGSGTGSATATATCSGASGGMVLAGLVLGALLVLVVGYILHKEGVPILPWNQAAVQQELVKEEEPRVPKKEVRLPTAEVDKTERPAVPAPEAQDYPARQESDSDGRDVEYNRLQVAPPIALQKCEAKKLVPKWDGVAWRCSKSSKTTHHGGPRHPALERQFHSAEEFWGTCQAIGWARFWSEKYERHVCLPKQG